MLQVLFLALCLCILPVQSQSCSLPPGPNITSSLVASNGDIAGTLQYIWTGDLLSFCFTTNTYFCIIDSSVKLSSTSTFSGASTVTNYGCSSRSQTTITTTSSDAFFQIEFTIKKFKNEFPIASRAFSYVVTMPSPFHSALNISYSYFNSATKFSSTDATFTYFANCVDLFHSITPGNVYTPVFYSYQDPNTPDLYKLNFYKINYLINADLKETLQTIASRWSGDDVQVAIWDLVHPTSGIYTSYPDSRWGTGFNRTTSLALRAYADTAPISWVPGPGDFDSLIAYSTSTVQDTMVHVPYNDLVAYVQGNNPSVYSKDFTISGVVKSSCRSDCNPVTQNLRNPVQSNVFVRIFNSANRNIGYTRTNVNGEFSFKVRQPLSYSLIITGACTSSVTLPAKDPSSPDYAPVEFFLFNVAQDTDGNNIADGCEVMTVSGNVQTNCAASCASSFNQASGVSGISVTIKKGGTTIATAVSNASGVYTFTNIPVDTYTVNVVNSALYTVCQADQPISFTVRTASFNIFQISLDTDSDGFTGTCDRCAGGAETDSNSNGTPDACEFNGLVATSCVPCGASVNNAIELAGVTVAIEKDGNTINAVTGANGRYSFTTIIAGPYTVSVVNSATITSCSSTTVTSGTAATLYAFSSTADSDNDGFSNYCDTCPGADADTDSNGLPDACILSGNVYSDCSESCATTFSIASAPVSGANLVLQTAAGASVATTTSSTAGSYTFNVPSTGEYSVAFGTNAGLVTCGAVSVSSGTVAPNLVAFVESQDSDNDGFSALCEVCAANIPDVDTDSNGLPDACTLSGNIFSDCSQSCATTFSIVSAPVPGANLVLQTAAGASVATTTSSATGSYTFNVPSTGEYSVAFGTNSGLVTCDPVAVSSGTVAPNLVAFVDSEDSDNDGFSALCEVCIPGVPDVDTDSNGLPDACTLSGNVYSDCSASCSTSFGIESSPVSGVNLVLQTAAGASVATAVTNVAGSYTFNVPSTGEYSVAFGTNAGLVACDPVAVSSGTVAPNLVAFVEAEDTDNDGFSSLCEVCLSAVADVDTDSNGQPDACALSGSIFSDCSESCATTFSIVSAPVSGVNLVLQNSVGAPIATTTSNAAGSYTFNVPSSGQYSVAFGTNAGLVTCGSVTAIFGSVAPNLVAFVDSQDSDNDGFSALCEVCAANIPDVDTDSNGLPDACTLSGNVHSDCSESCATTFSIVSAPVSGVNLVLLNAAGAPVGSATSNAQGSYSFDVPSSGQFNVGFGSNAGLSTCGPAPISTSNAPTLRIFVDAADSDNDGFNDACDVCPGVDVDTDSNGQPDACRVTGNVKADCSESCDSTFELATGVARVNLVLLNAAGAPVGSATSNAQGSYSFDVPYSGQFNVGFGSNVGLSTCGTTPISISNAPTLRVFVYAADSDNDGFNDACDICVPGVDIDTDSNGQPDVCRVTGVVKADCSETCETTFELATGVAGVNLVLLNAAGASIASATSNAQGSYSFDVPPTGEFYFGFGSNTGLVTCDPVPVSRGSSSTTLRVFVDAADSDNDGYSDACDVCPGIRDVDFDTDGEPDGCTISGSIKADCSRDCTTTFGIQRALVGVTVVLEDTEGTIYAEATTTENGNYTFEIPIFGGDFFVNFGENNNVVTCGRQPIDLMSFTAPNLRAFDSSNDADSDGFDNACDVCVGIDVDLDSNGQPDACRLQGFVREDCTRSCDSVQQLTTAIQGVNLELSNQANQEVASTSSSYDGSYSFDVPISGTYYVDLVNNPTLIDCGRVAVTTGTVAPTLYVFDTRNDSDNDELGDACDRCDGGREFDGDLNGVPDACEIRGNVFYDCSLDCSTTVISGTALSGIGVSKTTNGQRSTDITNSNGQYYFTVDSRKVSHTFAVVTNDEVVSCGASTLTGANQSPSPLFAFLRSEDSDNDGYGDECDKCENADESDNNSNGIPDACEFSGIVLSNCDRECSVNRQQTTPLSNAQVALTINGNDVVVSSDNSGQFRYQVAVSGSYAVRVLDSNGFFGCGSAVVSSTQPVILYAFNSAEDSDNDNIADVCDRCEGASESDIDGNGTPDACEIRGSVLSNCATSCESVLATIPSTLVTNVNVQIRNEANVLVGNQFTTTGLFNFAVSSHGNYQVTVTSIDHTLTGCSTTAVSGSQFTVYAHLQSSDSDRDGLGDSCDNCPTVPNPEQNPEVCQCNNEVCGYDPEFNTDVNECRPRIEFNCVSNYLSECTKQECIPGAGCGITEFTNYEFKFYFLAHEGSKYSLYAANGEQSNGTLIHLGSGDVANNYEWKTVAVDRTRKEIFAATTSGRIYQYVFNAELSTNPFHYTDNILSVSDLSLVDLVFDIHGNLWALFSTTDRARIYKVLKTYQTTTHPKFTLQFYQEIVGIGDCYSISIDNFGYSPLVHSSSGLHRVFSDSIVPLCTLDEDPVTSTGMYFSVSGVAFVAEDSKVNLIASNTCKASELNFVLPTSYQDVKFAAHEGCFVVVPPNPPPREDPPPPNNPPPRDNPPALTPPDPEGPTNIPVDLQVTDAVTIQQSYNYVLESYQSSIVVSGIATASVALFAIFGVILGLNNSKKKPLNPDIASLIDTEAVSVANENPIYMNVNEIQQNILA